METDGSPQLQKSLLTNKGNLPVVLSAQQLQQKIIDNSDHQIVEAMDTQESDMITDQNDIDNLSNNGDTQMQIAPPQIDSTTTAMSMDATSTSEVTSTTVGCNDGSDEEIRSEATFSFVVDNLSKLKESVLSPPCFVRNLPWKIMVMPRTDRNQPDAKSLGFFLQCNGDSESSSWSCNAAAELRLKSFKPGQDPFVRKIKHLFYSKENDWGFSYFMSWNEIFDPEKGYSQNDTIVLEVHVVAEAPHGVFWDSKKHTGYVGLKNQGATCYMNSLLQTLFFTNILRKAVYKMPTEADDSSKSVALALQRVFHELQTSDKPVGTKKLTKSFGWETLDSFMQHDVQEFLRVLLDKLESKMKGTCVEGTIPSLFEGKMSSYIKCKNIDYTSKRIETFYDIQLNIKGKKNIEESFNDYIKPETLEGDNKYDAGIHGFQEAEKGVIFKSFPPVLHLHLMRFQYDPVTDNSVKFNDRFEFYEHINLDKYLAEEENTPADYKLHAVLVHSGDNHGGHYVVYINPKADGKWCKFDDDVVASCSKIDAIDHNYGGIDDEMTINAKHCSNAYMLVYIRVSAIPKILENIANSDIPSELIEKLGEEKRMEQVRRRERSEVNTYVFIHVMLEEYFDGHQSTDLFDNEKIHPRVFKLKKTQTVDELMQVFVETFKYDASRMRIWSLVSRSQLTRPVYFDFNEEYTRNLQHVIETQSPWSIYLQLASPDHQGPLPPFEKNRDILLFFKYYDPIYKRLNYIGSDQYQLSMKICDLVPLLNKELGFPIDTELSIYEEQGPNVVSKITNMQETIEKVLRQNNRSDDVHGNVLIFEKKHQDEKLELPTCDDYFRDLLYRFEVTFIEKSNPNDSGFTLELSHRYTYDQMAQAVAKKINTDPNKIQFFKCLGYKDQPGNPLRCVYDGILKDLLAYNKPRTTKKIFYQRLSMSINELENKKQFKCLYLSPNMKDEKELVLYPNKSGTVKNLLEEATKQIEFSDDSTRKLRLLEVANHKVFPPLREDTPLENLQCVSDSLANQSNQKLYRIEEIPRDELVINDNEALIPVSHFSKEIYSSFGIPFYIKVKEFETIGAAKKSIQKKLNVPEKEFEKYKFAIVSMGRVEYFQSDNDPIDIKIFKQTSTQPGPTTLPYLGLDHINKSQKRSRYTYLEKAIKIYN
ncbi:ubiquitin carboxyl-terminal hydrolase 7 [Condylostylus longicornis]|uniref:ubiquitin carboxyl-terminal hydrolase 7 n=1 Tax=Condylostylus longicornis TaxID=2530218 RepID=UPI00244E0454|nr:ubiquitin carboxyl-terminal hydrolase 7 [Condylostylus longicornis]